VAKIGICKVAGGGKQWPGQVHDNVLLVARLFQTNLASVLEGALQCAACVDAGRDEESRMQLWMVITPLLSPHKAHSELVIAAPSRAKYADTSPADRKQKA
jgi:hypothetical protein